MRNGRGLAVPFRDRCSLPCVEVLLVALELRNCKPDLDVFEPAASKGESVGCFSHIDAPTISYYKRVRDA